jgi:hypothetical protein
MPLNDHQKMKIEGVGRYYLQNGILQDRNERETYDTRNAL